MFYIVLALRLREVVSEQDLHSSIKCSEIFKGRLCFITKNLLCVTFGYQYSHDSHEISSILILLNLMAN